jgi:hypothetical protein
MWKILKLYIKQELNFLFCPKLSKLNRHKTNSKKFRLIRDIDCGAQEKLQLNMAALRTAMSLAMNSESAKHENKTKSTY